MPTAFITDWDSRVASMVSNPEVRVVHVARFRLVDDDEKDWWDIRAEWAGGEYIELYLRGGRTAFEVWNVGPNQPFTHAAFKLLVQDRLNDEYWPGALRDALVARRVAKGKP